MKQECGKAWRLERTAPSNVVTDAIESDADEEDLIKGLREDVTGDNCERKLIEI